MSTPMGLDLTPEERKSAYEEWKAEGIVAVEFLCNLCKPGQMFSYDAVRVLIREPLHPNHHGALMRSAEVRAMARKVETRPSHTRTRRGGGVGWYEPITKGTE